MKNIFMILTVLGGLLLPVASAQTWTCIGPEGGDILGVVVDPTDPDVLTMVRGETWTIIPDLSGLWVERAGSIISDPATGTLYIATAEGGVLKSEDQGLTWTAKNDGLTSSSINKLAMDTRNGYLYAAIPNGSLYRCEIPAAPLWAQYGEVPEAGGSVEFSLDAGSANANRNYIICGGATGTEPGTLLPGGYATIPVNFDAFTYDVVFPMLNTTIFSNFLGKLDADGQASAQLNIPPVPGFAGLPMYYAYCCNNNFDYVSNPVQINIVN